MQALRQSIKKQQLLEPIVVRPHPRKKRKFEIIFGYGRWKAYRPDDLIPCVIRDVNDLQAMIMSITENMVRSDLCDVDRERIITQTYEKGLKEKEWKNITEMAQKNGLPFRKISANINAYNDRKKLQIRDHEKISTSDLKESRPLKNYPELQKKVLEQRARGELKGIHKLHETAKDLANQQKTTNPTNLDQFTTSTATVAPATTTQPTQITTIIKEPEKTQTPSQPTPPLPDKPPEATPAKTIPVKIDEENQNKPCIDTQTLIVSPLDDLQEYTAEVPSLNHFQPIIWEESYRYLYVLQGIVPRDITSLESSCERKEVILWMKEIEDRIDELLQIVDGKSFFPRQYYRGIR